MENSLQADYNKLLNSSNSRKSGSFSSNTTPFSINDILTKNKNSSESLSDSTNDIEMDQENYTKMTKLESKSNGYSKRYNYDRTSKEESQSMKEYRDIDKMRSDDKDFRCEDGPGEGYFEGSSRSGEYRRDGERKKGYRSSTEQALDMTRKNGLDSDSGKYIFCVGDFYVYTRYFLSCAGYYLPVDVNVNFFRSC